MFIFAKVRESNNFKEKGDLEQRGYRATDGDDGFREDTSGNLREWEAHEFPECSGSPTYRPHDWSCNHFIRPEDSFLGHVLASSLVPPVVSGGIPDSVPGVLPPQRTVMLNASLDSGAGGAVCGDANWKGQRSPRGVRCGSSSGPPVVSPTGRRMVRFRCHTCSEKLPTLNSLRTHLKSHSRPATLNHPVALRSDQRLMPSTVVTSKYGRRRAVVSALAAIKPGPLKR